MKKEILLFTGWGATCDVWSSIIPALSKRYQVNCHKPSWVCENEMHSSIRHFDQYIDELASQLKHEKYIIAWSMGGLLAIALAKRYPQLVKKICFISSTANFVSQHDEYAGIDFDWFQSFCAQYQAQPVRTLKKFLTLQIKNDVHAKQTLIELKKACPFDQYDLVECGHALQLLLTLNFKSDLPDLKCSVCYIHGRQDAVVNTQAVQHCAALSKSSLHCLDHAGHVPQLSHAQEVLSIIDSEFK